MSAEGCVIRESMIAWYRRSLRGIAVTVTESVVVGVFGVVFLVLKAWGVVVWYFIDAGPFPVWLM